MIFPAKGTVTIAFLFTGTEVAPMENTFKVAAVQAEPIYFNASKTVEKAASLIDEAGRQVRKLLLSRRRGSRGTRTGFG